MRALLLILVPMCALAGVMTLIFWTSAEKSDPRHPVRTQTAEKAAPRTVTQDAPSPPVRPPSVRPQPAPTSAPGTQVAAMAKVVIEAADDWVNIQRSKIEHDRKVQLNFARQALDAGRPAEAIPACDRILAANPDDVEALSAKALALVALGRMPEAMALNERAVKLSPDDIRLRYNLATIQSRLRMFSEAIRNYEFILSKQPDHARALYNLAVILQDEGKLSEAARLWERVTQSNPDIAGAWLNRGTVALQMREFATAVTALTQADRLEPGKVDTLVNLGTALQGAGKPVEAVAAYRKALEIQRDCLPAVNGMAEVYLAYFEKHPDAADQLECALQWCEYSFKIKPAQPRLAVLYQRAVKVQPDSVPALNGLARVLATGKPSDAGYQENHDKAVELLKKSLALNPDQPEMAALLERLTGGGG